MADRTCRICGLEPTRFIYEKWGFQITRCQSCGVGQTEVPEGFNLVTFASPLPLPVFNTHAGRRIA